LEPNRHFSWRFVVSHLAKNERDVGHPKLRCRVYRDGKLRGLPVGNMR
jgi:hypothetical protein